MAKKIPKDALKIAATVSKESGVPLDNILDAHAKKAERIDKMIRSTSGKFKVIGIDKFDGGDWVQGEYNSAEEALEEARKLTAEAMESASHYSIATVYYAYSPKGEYLGGDTWKKE